MGAETRTMGSFCSCGEVEGRKGEVMPDPPSTEAPTLGSKSEKATPAETATPLQSGTDKAAESKKPIATHCPHVLAVAQAHKGATGEAEGGVFNTSLRESVRASDSKGLVPYPIRHCCA